MKIWISFFGLLLCNIHAFSSCVAEENCPTVRTYSKYLLETKLASKRINDFNAETREIYFEKNKYSEFYEFFLLRESPHNDFYEFIEVGDSLIKEKNSMIFLVKKQSGIEKEFILDFGCGKNLEKVIEEEKIKFLRKK